MATWRSTALAAAALVLLAGVQTVVCKTVPEKTCDVPKATTCYWDEAKFYGVGVLQPGEKKKEQFLQNVCQTEDKMPETSECSKDYDGCSAEQQKGFEDQEKGYTQLRNKLTDTTLCKDVSQLLTCIDKNELLNCPTKFADEYSAENVEKNHKEAVKLSGCLKKALEPCTKEEQTKLKTYLSDIAESLTKLYTNKLPPTPSPPVVTTTTGPVTTKSPVTTTPSGTTGPATDPSPTVAPTTTPAPPSAAPSVHALGAVGVALLALLARGA